MQIRNVGTQFNNQRMYIKYVNDASQMTSLLPGTNSEHFLKPPHRSLQNFTQQDFDFSTNGKYQLFDCVWFVHLHFPLGICIQQKGRHLTDIVFPT